MNAVGQQITQRPGTGNATLVSRILSFFPSATKLSHKPLTVARSRCISLVDIRSDRPGLPAKVSRSSRVVYACSSHYRFRRVVTSIILAGAIAPQSDDVHHVRKEACVSW